MTPGQEDVYRLIAGGVATQEILDAVEAILTADKVRPLSDTVVVQNPTVINYNIELIQFLLPLTIFFTSFSNIFKKKDNFRYQGNMQKNYFLALIFGAIHGFSYGKYLTDFTNGSMNIWNQFSAFNIGIGSGQILVSLSFLLIAFFFLNIIGINRRDWIMVISSGIAGVALTLMFELKFW